VTVHKSKGLEYPVVCLPFAGSFRPLDRRTTAYLSLPAHDGVAASRELVLDYDSEQLEQADRERLREDLRLFYVALTRPRHALWMALAPMKRGNGKACVNEQGAAGYLLAGPEKQSPAQWRASVAALAGGCGYICVKDLPAELPEARRWTAAEEAPALGSAPGYAAEFDRRWGIGSFSSLTRAMAAPNLPVLLPVLPFAVLSPADDEAQAAAQEGTVAIAMPDMAPMQVPVGAVWHRFMRGPVVGNFLHDQLEWLSGEGFGLPEQESDESTGLEARLLRRCERAGRKEQAGDVLRWLRAVVHQRLSPLDVSLAQLGERDALLAEMEFWLPAQRLSAQRVDDLCREHMLPGQPRPALPQRELHGMLMGFADLVFCHAGRYWVLDYKTNHLGADGSAYTAEALAEAMLHHRYDVQAALYLLALHRLLKSRLGEGYEPTQHLGGALYFFVRGLDGDARGMLELPSSPQMLALLEALDALLSEPEALA
jgi:exodeoxyribonuclease V beta subunit